MTEQKRKLSKLCLWGFICSFLALVVGIVGFELPDHYRTLRRHANRMLLLKWTFAIVIILAVVGLILAIKGIISCRDTGRSGKILAIAGIIIVIFIMINLAAYIIPAIREFTNPESPPTSAGYKT